KQCRDGFYAFHLPDTSDSLWKALCEGMGEPSAAQDERFATEAARRKNYEQVEAKVSEWVRDHTRAELWEIFSKIGLSSAPVLSLGEVLEDEHLRERDAFVEVDHPEAGRVTLLAPWVRMSRTPAAIERPAPLVGQDNEEVFRGILGVDGEEY